MKLKLVILESKKKPSKRKVLDRDADFHCALEFEDVILESMNQRNIEIYAENYLEMADVNDLNNMDDIDLSDFPDDDLKHVLEQRGYRVIRCETITESMQLDEILNQTTLTS